MKGYAQDKGYLGKSKCTRLNEYMIIEDKVHRIHRVIVHKFRMGDVDDPDLYAAQPLWEWQQTEMGKFVMERSVETPVWHRQQDIANYGYSYVIEAWLKGVDYSFWVLKWGNEVDNPNTFRI